MADRLRRHRPSETSLGLTSPLLPSDSQPFRGETESRAGQKEKKGKGRGRRSSSVSMSGESQGEGLETCPTCTDGTGNRDSHFTLRVPGARRRATRPVVLPSPIPIPVPLGETDPTSALSASTIHDSFSPISAFSPTPPTPRTGLPGLASFSPAMARDSPVMASLHLGALGSSWAAPSDTRIVYNGGFGLGLNNREVDELDEEDEDEMAFVEMEDKDRSITSGMPSGSFHLGGHYYSSSTSTGVGITTPGTASSSTFTHDLPSANSTPSYEFSRSHPAPSYFSSSLFPSTNSAANLSSYTSYRSPNNASTTHHLPPLPSIKWGSEAYHLPTQQPSQPSGGLSAAYTGQHRYHKSQDSFGFTSPTTVSSDTSAMSTSNLPTMFSQSLPVSKQSMYTTSRPGMYSVGSDTTLPTLQSTHHTQPQHANAVNTSTSSACNSGLNVFIPRGTLQYGGPMSAPAQSDPYRFSSISDPHAGEYEMTRSGDGSVGGGGFDGRKSNGLGTRNHDGR